VPCRRLLAILPIHVSISGASPSPLLNASVLQRIPTAAVRHPCRRRPRTFGCDEAVFEVIGGHPLARTEVAVEEDATYSCARIVEPASNVEPASALLPAPPCRRAASRLRELQDSPAPATSI
jgi:hypothetical protein